MKREDFHSPGQMLKALLAERGWTQELLATILGMHLPAVNLIATNKRAVTAELSIALGEIFGKEPGEFLQVQKEYELAVAQIVTRPDPTRAIRTHLFGSLPIPEMIRRGWLEADDIKDVPKVEKALAKFFGVESVGEIQILPHAAKKMDTFTEVTPAQLAWIYRVKQIADEMLVPKYSQSAARKVLSQMRNLLIAPESVRKAPRILAESGIRYVIVETLPKAKIDGVCLWLDDKSPVIGMSLRFDRIDNFWFVLRHEIEHVLREHGRSTVMLDAELEGERAGTGGDLREEERQANEAAAEYCVPQNLMDGFIARKAPFFKDADILGFANMLHIHPGLVAGQLQHKTGRYDRFRHHLTSVRSAIAPSAMVDGWGDIAPVDQ